MDNWSSIFKTAITVILILLVLGIVFYLAYLGYNAANQGAEKLASQTATMDQRVFDPYNQTTISGSTVLSAIMNFSDQPTAVIVKTNRNSATDMTNYCARLAPVAGDITGITYSNANLTAVGAAPQVQRLTTAHAVYPQVQNRNTNLLSNKTNINYVNPTARFRSVLIFDTNDQVVGIYMEQVPGAGAAAPTGHILQ